MSCAEAVCGNGGCAEAFVRRAMCFDRRHNLSTTTLPTDYDTLYRWAKEMTVTDESGEKAEG